MTISKHSVCSRQKEEPVDTTGSTLEYSQLCQLDAGVADGLRWRAALVKIARVGLSLTVTKIALLTLFLGANTSTPYSGKISYRRGASLLSQ